MPRRHPHPALLLALAGALACLGPGCAMAGPAGSSGGPDGKTDGIDPSASAPTLAPAYAATISSQVVTADLEGDDPELFESRVDGFVVPVATDEGTKLYFQPCRVELPEVGGRKPTLADETVRSRPPVEFAATFAEDADGVLTLATETGALTLGVDLEDAINDELPTDGDDPRVADHDDDDEDGVTVRIAGFRIFLAARARMWIAGVVDPETGNIAGDADLSIDAEIYGDSIPFVNARADAEEARNDDSREVIQNVTGFEFVPMAEAPQSCADLTL